jgi:hypothetical protein
MWWKGVEGEVASPLGRIFPALSARCRSLGADNLGFQPPELDCSAGPPRKTLYKSFCREKIFNNVWYTSRSNQDTTCLKEKRREVNDCLCTSHFLEC